MAKRKKLINRKAVSSPRTPAPLYNITIDDQFQRWESLKRNLRFNSDSKFAAFLLNSFVKCTCRGLREETLPISSHNIDENAAVPLTNCVREITVSGDVLETTDDVSGKTTYSCDKSKSEILCVEPIITESTFEPSESEGLHHSDYEEGCESLGKQEDSDCSLATDEESRNYDTKLQTPALLESKSIEVEALSVFKTLQDLSGQEEEVLREEDSSIEVSIIGSEQPEDVVEQDNYSSLNLAKKCRKNARLAECPSTIKSRSYTMAFRYLMTLEETKSNEGETWQHFERLGPNLSTDTAKEILILCEKIKDNAIRKREERVTINCPLCSRKYTVKTSFLIHIRIWHLTRYKCKYCQKVNTSITHMLQHLKRVHKNGEQPLRQVSKERPLCDICGKDFTNKVTLKNHRMAVHRQERNFPCTWPGCAKHFKRPGHLKIHLRIHTDEKPLVCPKCGFRCRQRNSLNWHIRVKHPASSAGDINDRVLPQAEVLNAEVLASEKQSAQPAETSTKHGIESSQSLEYNHKSSASCVPGRAGPAGSMDMTDPHVNLNNSAMRRNSIAPNRCNVNSSHSTGLVWPYHGTLLPGSAPTLQQPSIWDHQSVVMYNMDSQSTSTFASLFQK